VAYQPALDVAVELLGVLELVVPGEDRVGLLGGQLPAALGVAGLEDHRVTLRAARDAEPALDVELVAAVGEPAAVGVPQFFGGPDELAGPLVPKAVVQETAAPEVLPEERPGRGDHVPGCPPAGQMVQGGELAGQFVRLVEGGVEGPGQAEPFGHRGQGGQHGQGVRAADHVQVVDEATLFAEPQALGQEEEVEQAAFGGPGQVLEGAEVDLTAGPRVAPHGRVVHAREVRAEDDLLRQRDPLSD
jgi:hypothetical protein